MKRTILLRCEILCTHKSSTHDFSTHDLLPMSFQQKHLLISGRVQRVGFRHFTKRSADHLGVTGWVRNLPDGRGEAVTVGVSPSLETPMANPRERLPASSPDAIEFRDIARGESEQLDGRFEIRR